MPALNVTAVEMHRVEMYCDCASQTVKGKKQMSKLEKYLQNEM